MSEIGTVITGPHIEQAVVDVLNDFLPVYLADRAADQDLPRSTFQVKEITRAATVDTRFPEDQLPCVTVRCVTKTREYVEGTGHVAARFNVAVGAMLADQSIETSSDVAWAYGAAIEALLLQHGALGGLAEGVEWNTTVPSDVELRDRRTQAGVVVDVDVIVPATVNINGGPMTPPDEPYEPLPADQTPLSVDVVVDRVDVQ